MSRPRCLSRCSPFLLALFLLSHNALGDPLPCTQDRLCRDSLDRAVAFDKQGRYEPALRELKAAYQQQKDPRVATNLGLTLCKLRRCSEALSYYKEAERAAPSDAALQQKLKGYIAQATQNLSSPSGGAGPSGVSGSGPASTRVEAKSSSAHAEATVHNNIQVSPNIQVLPQIQVSPNIQVPAPAPTVLPRYKSPWLWAGLGALTVGAIGLGVGLAAREPSTDGYPTYPLRLAIR